MLSYCLPLVDTILHFINFTLFHHSIRSLFFTLAIALLSSSADKFFYQYLFFRGALLSILSSQKLYPQLLAELEQQFQSVKHFDIPCLRNYTIAIFGGRNSNCKCFLNFFFEPRHVLLAATFILLLLCCAECNSRTSAQKPGIRPEDSTGSLVSPSFHRWQSF